MVKVFHNQQYQQYQLDTSNVKFITAELVAEVNTGSLNHALFLTNDANTHNPVVIPMGHQTRGTSMGDILEAAGHYFVVISGGFRELRPDELEMIHFTEDLCVTSSFA